MEAFAVKDCALIPIATGKEAQNLRELKDRLQDIHSGCIYHHFWGGLLVPRFDDPEFQNDFASWAYHGLNDRRLAERLGIIDPMAFDSIEDLRRRLVEVIEDRLDEMEVVPWAKSDRRFYFIRSKIVVFDTRIRIEDPETLRQLIPRLPVSSIFYHFIDARRRTPDGSDDFSRWISNLEAGYGCIADRLESIDPYFTSLAGLRSQIYSAFEDGVGRKNIC